MAGSRQESNFKIWRLDHQIHQASIFMPAELTWFSFELAVLATCNTTPREFFRCTMKLYLMGDVKF